MKRAVAYVRVSTSGQAEHGMGLEVQRRKVREYAKAEGLELVRIVDEAASGAVHEGELSSIEHRPVLSRLLADAQAGGFDCLIVASFDRLSRDQLDAQLLKRWFAKHRVRCLSAAGETNGAEGPLAELIDRILGAIHDFDRKRILERVSAGKAEKKRQGRHVHGRIPYGYRSAGEGRLEVDEAQAEVVRRIFRDVRDGYSLGRIARELNRDGIPGPQGGSWSGQVIGRMLRNPIYAGERYGIKRAQPAIVSARLWNAVNGTRERG